MLHPLTPHLPWFKLRALHKKVVGENDSVQAGFPSAVRQGIMGQRKARDCFSWRTFQNHPEWLPYYQNAPLLISSSLSCLRVSRWTHSVFSVRQTIIFQIEALRPCEDILSHSFLMSETRFPFLGLHFLEPFPPLGILSCTLLFPLENLFLTAKDLLNHSNKKINIHSNNWQMVLSTLFYFYWWVHVYFSSLWPLSLLSPGSFPAANQHPRFSLGALLFKCD